MATKRKYAASFEECLKKGRYTGPEWDFLPLESKKRKRETQLSVEVQRVIRNKKDWAQETVSVSLKHVQHIEEKIPDPLPDQRNFSKEEVQRLLESQRMRMELRFGNYMRSIVSRLESHYRPDEGLRGRPEYIS